MSPAGLLLVTMDPRPGLPPARFHDWYHNEHGPARLRLPHIFTNGFRYKAAASRGGEDRHQPAFMAVYDVTAMSHLESDTYTGLRAPRSPREARTMEQVHVGRSLYDWVHTRQSPVFAPLETLPDEQAEGIITVAVDVALGDGDGAR